MSKFIIVVVVALIIVSCLGKKDGGSSSSNQISQDIVGKYSSCTLDQRTYSKQTFEFSSTSLVGTVYELSSCDAATSSNAMVINFNYSYSIPGTTSVSGTTDIDITALNSGTMTLNSDTYVSMFNAGSVCGGSWVKGTAKSIVNCDLDSDGKVDFPNTFYSIYQIASESGKTVLKLGDETQTYDGTTKAKRHNALEGSGDWLTKE